MTWAGGPCGRAGLTSPVNSQWKARSNRLPVSTPVQRSVAVRRGGKPAATRPAFVAEPGSRYDAAPGGLSNKDGCLRTQAGSL